MSRGYISLGTSIKRNYYLSQGLSALERAFGELTLSSLFESEAVGFNGNAFYNMVIGFTTERSIDDVAVIMRDIEYANGREVDAKKYSARTLDLDLLLFDELILEQPVAIPRAEICTNAFVLWPLAEIAGSTLHPVKKQTIAELWQRYDKDSQQLKKIPFTYR